MRLPEDIHASLKTGPQPGIKFDAEGYANVDVNRCDASLVADLAPGSGQVVPVNGAAFLPNRRVAVMLSDSEADRSVGKASTLVVAETSTGRVVERITIPRVDGIFAAPYGTQVFVRNASNDQFDAVNLVSGGILPFGEAAPHDARRKPPTAVSRLVVDSAMGE